MRDIQSFKPFDEGIRKVWDEKTGEWWYAVVDVVELLAKPSRVREYWRKMKVRDFAEVSPFWCQFKLKHKSNGRMYNTDCANQKGMLRIIQSIPSAKAETFKQWLAMTGSRRLDEIKANPIEAERERLRLLGFSDKEIDVRLGHLSVGLKLENQWEKREVSQNETEILTDEIHKGTFEGMTRGDHKSLKGIDLQSDIYDHMTASELAFSMVGKASTIDEIAAEDPQGFEENLDSAKRGGMIAGKLRRSYEEQTGRKVISDKSPLIERRNEIQGKNDEE